MQKSESIMCTIQLVSYLRDKVVRAVLSLLFVIFSFQIKKSRISMDSLNWHCFFFFSRGIPYISKDRDIRMPAIGEFLAANNHYDVISLQEVWTEHDYQLIRKIAEKTLPFSYYFYR